MIFKHLYFQIVIRIILIVVNALLLAYTYFYFDNPLTFVNLILLLILQAFLLIYYLNKMNRDVTRFIHSIRNEDTVFIKPKKISKSYQNLWDEFMHINESFKKIKIQNEKSDFYFKTITENIPNGLIVIDSKGHLKHSNKEAMRLLNDPGTILIDLNILEQVKGLKPNKPLLIKKIVEDQLCILSLVSTILKENNESTKIISIQNITNELDNKELESWHKLIQVINHEIRNSVAPISSTIQALQDHLEKTIKGAQSEQYERLISKTKEGLKIIKSQSDGLNDFINKYQYFSNVPELSLKKINIYELMNKCIDLFKRQFEDSKIEFIISKPLDLIYIQADEILLQRMFINLLTNAMYANADQITIVFETQSHPKLQIRIEDNGNGIADEFIDKIFIPFFTTREHGSGIGLSFSRQIMKLHQGNISVQSKLGEGSIFFINF